MTFLNDNSRPLLHVRQGRACGRLIPGRGQQVEAVHGAARRGRGDQVSEKFDTQGRFLAPRTRAVLLPADADISRGPDRETVELRR